MYEHDTVADQRRRGLRDAGRSLAIVVGVVLVLQVPFLISRFTEPGAPAGPTSLIAGLIESAGRSGRWIAFDTVTGITGNLVLPMTDTLQVRDPDC